MFGVDAILNQLEQSISQAQLFLQPVCHNLSWSSLICELELARFNPDYDGLCTTMENILTGLLRVNKQDMKIFQWRFHSQIEQNG